MPLRSFVILIVVSVVLILRPSASLCKTPVIIIPGIEGSKLCDVDGNVLWGDRKSYTVDRINALRLPPDLSNRDKGIHSCGLIESVSLIPLLWDSNVYSGLLNTLRKIGYRESEIVPFDYDWRLSNFENAELLKNKIEGLSLGSGGQVDLVAHSMGGLIARVYIQSLGGATRVHNLIFLGTPNFGSARVFQNLRDGFDHWPNAWSGGLDEIQRTILSFPSTFQLLPTYSNCCGFSKNGEQTNIKYVDILDPKVWERFTWLPADLKAGPRFDALSSYLREAQQLKSLMHNPITEDPLAATRIHYIANGFLDTWSRVFFDERTGAISSYLSRPGDGTVLLFSATNGNPSAVQVSHKEHELVFVGEEPELVIKAALSDQNWTGGPAEFTQLLVDAQGHKFRVDSGSVHITPQAALPGQTVVLRIDLNGKGLNDAELSNVSADLVNENRTIAHFSLKDLGNNGTTRSLASEFKAPTQSGAYQVRTVVPGLQEIELIFAVFGD